MVAPHAATKELMPKLPGARRAEREEPAPSLERRRSVAVDHGRVDVQRVEPLGEVPHLVLGHLAQDFGCEPAVTEIVEHLARAVMAGRVVRCAGETGGDPAPGDAG